MGAQGPTIPHGTPWDRIFWPGSFSFTSMIQAQGPIMLYGVPMKCYHLLLQWICSPGFQGFHVLMIFYSFPGCQGLSYVHDLISTFIFIVIAFRVRICSIIFFHKYQANNQSDSLEVYGWHFRGTQLRVPTRAAKSEISPVMIMMAMWIPVLVFFASYMPRLLRSQRPWLLSKLTRLQRLSWDNWVESGPIWVHDTRKEFV